MANSSKQVPQYSLLEDLKQLIDSARQSIATTVNSTMTMLYWQIGKRIYTEILNENRAEYGKQIIIKLAKELSQDYGKAFSDKNIRRMVQFAEIFYDEQIVVSLIRQLSWTHIIALIPIKDPIKRDFYTQICQLEKWSVRQLRERINSMLFERTAISRKSENSIQNDLEQLRKNAGISPDLVFRDSYFLDFLGLSDVYSEKDLESVIMLELQRFITELGQDFAFIARQKRIIIDNRDYYIDLLFYHRRLKCLVVIDLKLGDFEASYKGQMELYLRYLEKYEQIKGENSPIGLVLCAGKSEEHVELLQLYKSNIRVAEYFTQLPPKEILQAKLQQSLEIAKAKLLAQGLENLKILVKE